MAIKTPDISQTMEHAARTAGAYLMSAFQAPRSITAKSAGDFVSDADLGAEDIIKSILTKAYPDYGWLAEESGGVAAGSKGLYWVVDPLDGTANFLAGLPHWAVSIALCDGADVIAGVIFDPPKDELFWARQGQGAHLNGHPITVSTNDDFQAALFATGVPAGGRITYLPHCLRDLENLMPRCAGVRRWGAAALDLAYVAAGRVDGYWERNLGAWDIAAGMLIVQEAGGIVTPMWEDCPVLTSGSFIASAPQHLRELTSLLDQTP